MGKMEQDEIRIQWCQESYQDCAVPLRRLGSVSRAGTGEGMLWGILSSTVEKGFSETSGLILNEIV